MDNTHDTRDILLDAAEHLFAEKGVQATSLRAITQRAGTNLAAVNYHFGSKDGLVRAVFRRRLEPVNEERLRLLTKVEESSGDDGPTTQQVLRAFFEPVIRFQSAGGSSGGGNAQAAVDSMRRLMGRTFSEPGLEMQRLLKGQFEVVVRRFTAALARCAPHLSAQELMWRLHFMVGSIIQVTLNGSLIYEVSGGRCDPRDVGTLTQLMVAYAKAGLEAPAVLVREPSAKLEDPVNGLVTGGEAAPSDAGLDPGSSSSSSSDSSSDSDADADSGDLQ